MKSFRQKLLLCSFLAMMFTLALTLVSLAGTWLHDGSGWWYQNNDGSYPKGRVVTIDGQKYAFNSKGYMISSKWVELVDGHWVYCLSSGALAKNQWVGDYYFGDNCVMLTDTWVGDYYVDGSGKWVPGKQKSDSQTASSGSSNSGQYGQYGSSSGTDIRQNYIYGRYNNIEQLGFWKDHYVDMSIDYDYADKTNNLSFGLFEPNGYTMYSYYDLYNPSGDTLQFEGYQKGTYSAVSTKSSHKVYKVEYDGKDMVIVYWMPVTWNMSDGDGALVFKKYADYDYDLSTLQFRDSGSSGNSPGSTGSTGGTGNTGSTGGTGGVNPFSGNQITGDLPEVDEEDLPTVHVSTSWY